MADTAEAPQEAQQGGFSWRNFLIQMVLFQLVMRMFGPSRNQQTKDPLTGEIIPPLMNGFLPNTEFDLFVHLSPYEHRDFVGDLLNTSEATLLFTLPDLKYNHVNWSKEFLKNVTFTPSPEMYSAIIKTSGNDTYESQMKNNYFLVASAVPHDVYAERRMDDSELHLSTFEPNANKRIALGSTHLVTQMVPFTTQELQSLMGSDTFSAEDKKNPSKDAKLPHFKSKIDIRIVYDQSALTPQTASQPIMRRHLRTFPEDGHYLPIIQLSDLWSLERDYVPLNGTLSNTPLQIRLSWNSMSQWWFMMYSQMADMWDPEEKTAKTTFSFQGHTRKESFMLKRILLDTNPYFLAFSAGFILLHSVFSFLAFKNEISFWRNNESMEGLSALSVVASFICEIIIGLYLFDSEDTSWLILLEIAAGIAISGWKLTKAVKMTFSPQFPFLKLSDAKDYKKSDTKKYDEKAIKFMTLLLLPCVIGYAIYAVYYNKYRSWYSYVVSVLAGTVYTFGFVMMTPQLYINYKLQSVDHLPWRALVYKALNTFVDDIAAFMIDMPWMHRLACFRDDVIFVAYVYQRWAYRVDKTRPSEWVDPKEQRKLKEEVELAAAADKETPPRIEEIFDEEEKEDTEETEGEIRDSADKKDDGTEEEEEETQKGLEAAPEEAVATGVEMHEGDLRRRAAPHEAEE